MKIIFSESSNLNNSVYGNCQAPIKMFLEKRGEEFEQNSVLKNLFLMGSSKNYGDVMTTLTAMSGFEPVGENGAYPLDGMQEGYQKFLKYQTWKDSFSVSKEMIEDGKLLDMRSDGTFIGGMQEALDESGLPIQKPVRIPYYRPDRYPIILQRSVSVFGQLLGNSDVDMIRDQQNTSNRIEQKIIDRLMKAGTRITLPDRVDLRTDPEDGERWYIGKPSDKSLIDVYDFSGNLQYELTYLAQVYEEARQIIGITDSFQGRQDTTATSGKAKEFSAAQAAGRLESKRVMKNAAYAELFETMFKFWLAYSDEPRPVTYKDSTGETMYEEFNRYDFLEEGEDGELHWNDQFLFSCDTSAPLASNREAMWQETRQNLEGRAFGDPTDLETLILFWAKMEELHYPGAAQTKKHLEEKAQRQEEMAAQQAAQQAAMQGDTPGGGAGVPDELAAAIDAQAQADAMNAVQNGGQGQMLDTAQQ